MNIAEPMTSLYESLFDVNDNINNVDRVHLIGEEYEIDVNRIECSYIDRIFKAGIIKVVPKYNQYDSPKITQFEDKENKIIKALCKLILNLPINHLESDRTARRAMIEYTNEYEKFPMTGCKLVKSGGHIFMSAGGKSFPITLDNGEKTYTTPRIYIPLIKK